MAPGAQVGSALLFQPLRDHAILWRDTPESWIDMHPSFHPNKNSYMFATTGDLHVGRSSGRAGIWFGDDPDSFHDQRRRHRHPRRACLRRRPRHLHPHPGRRLDRHPRPRRAPAVKQRDAGAV
ncbi:hypothetical protein FBT69_11350 [Synechococcales cyanobacterium CNB]|nr:hypothetical protein [Synechococcales cyanobacterium CNB]